MSSAEEEVAPQQPDALLTPADREYLARYLSEDAMRDLLNLLAESTPEVREPLVAEVREHAEAWGDRAWFIAAADVLHELGELSGGDS